MESFGDIEAIISEIEKEAQKEITEAIEEAKKYAEEKIKKAEREGKIRKRRILKEKEKEAEKIKTKILSGVNVELKKIKLENQNKIMEKVFQKFKEKLNKFQDTEKYKNFLIKLIKEGEKVLNTEKEIEYYFSIRDRDKITDSFIKEAGLEKKNIKFTDDIKGGVILKVKGEKVIYNNSIESRIERYREYLTLRIYERLKKDENRRDR